MPRTLRFTRTSRSLTYRLKICYCCRGQSDGHHRRVEMIGLRDQLERRTGWVVHSYIPLYGDLVVTYSDSMDGRGNVAWQTFALAPALADLASLTDVSQTRCSDGRWTWRGKLRSCVSPSWLFAYSVVALTSVYTNELQLAYAKLRELTVHLPLSGFGTSALTLRNSHRLNIYTHTNKTYQHII